MIEIPFDEDRGFFQPSIGLKSGETISKLLEGEHLKRSRLSLSKANRFNFRGKFFEDI